MTTRRGFLKGVSLGAGSLVLGPLVGQLQAQAAGAAVQPKRFVFVIEGAGMIPHQIMPAGVSRDKTNLIDKSLKDLVLPKALEPLKPWQDKVTILEGLSGRVTGGGHSTDFGCLGIYNGKSTSPRAETIDAALAKKVPGIFPLVTLGIVDKPSSNTIVYNCSAWDRGKALPTQLRPDLAYNNLFGSVAAGAAKQEFLAKGNVLDFLRDDIKALDQQVAGPEKEKLDQHIAALEAMRDRQSRLNEIESTLRKNAPTVSNKYHSKSETDTLDAHFDLAAASLISGLTNVVTLASGVGGRYFNVRFGGLGINFAKHNIGHGQSNEGKTSDEMQVIIRRFHFELIARLMKKLEAVKEGPGTMLDNTVILYLGDAPDAHHSKAIEWPCVLVGNMGGKLKAGRYLEYPWWGKKGHREMGNLYNTLLQCAGPLTEEERKRDFFGVKDPMLRDLKQNGTLAELLA